jgi:hypothetical protein
MSDWEDRCGQCDSEDDLKIRCETCTASLISAAHAAERARIVRIIDAMMGYLDGSVFVDRIELKRRIGESK